MQVVGNALAGHLQALLSPGLWTKPFRFVLL